MKLDINKLTKYDLSNAKVGDKVIIGECYNQPRWRFGVTTVKSVSEKRGYVTMSNGKRYEKDGKKIGGGRWDNHYSDRVFVYTQDSIQIVKDYIESMSKVDDIVELINKIEKQWFKTLYDLSEDKINILHKTMTEIFEMSEDD